MRGKVQQRYPPFQAPFASFTAAAIFGVTATTSGLLERASALALSVMTVVAGRCPTVSLRLCARVASTGQRIEPIATTAPIMVVHEETSRPSQPWPAA